MLILPHFVNFFFEAIIFFRKAFIFFLFRLLCLDQTRILFHLSIDFLHCSFHHFHQSINAHLDQLIKIKMCFYTCYVCFNHYKIEEMLSSTCNHPICSKCIQSLQEHTENFNSCPVCKSPISDYKPIFIYKSNDDELRHKNVLEVSKWEMSKGLDWGVY